MNTPLQLSRACYNWTAETFVQWWWWWWWCDCSQLMQNTMESLERDENAYNETLNDKKVSRSLFEILTSLMNQTCGFDVAVAVLWQRDVSTFEQAFIFLCWCEFKRQRSLRIILQMYVLWNWQNQMCAVQKEMDEFDAKLDRAAKMVDRLCWTFVFYYDVVFNWLEISWARPL